MIHSRLIPAGLAAPDVLGFGPVNPSMTTSPQTRHVEAILMLLLANLFWGLSFPLIKSLLILNGKLVPEADSWFATLYTVAPRFILAALILALVDLRGFWRITRRELQQGFLIGLFSAAGMLLQNDGMHYTEASTSAFLTQFYAIMIPVAVALRHRRNPGARVWVSCLLVLVGVAILGRFDWSALSFGRGEGETLLASFFFMGQILCLGWARYTGNRAAKITLVMFVTQAVIFAGLTGMVTPSAEALLVPWTSGPWLLLTAALTLVCTVGAFTLMNKWQPKISTTEAGLLYCVEPIFGSSIALFLPAIISAWALIEYPNETATWTLLVGGALITIANVLIQLQPRRSGAASK